MTWRMAIDSVGKQWLWSHMRLFSHLRAAQPQIDFNYVRASWVSVMLAYLKVSFFKKKIGSKKKS